MIVKSGNLSEIPDQTALKRGPRIFMIDLPEDDDGNEIPLDAAVEDTIFLDELYDSFLQVCCFLSTLLSANAAHLLSRSG